ncbi:WAS/WASL-interacting protein family member 1-like [Lineus longissimus]|uniref:WAS/WASL-interacting protein family member 1-like n=1 Tax=Lineus longissimus TaxID=88925 RepID=UPI00315C8F49
MSRPNVPAAPAPPPLTKLRALAAARDSAATQSSAPPLPNGTSRPQLQHQLPQSMHHTQNTQFGPPTLPTEKYRSQSVKTKGPPSLPPGKPRAHSMEGKYQAPPPPPPQRTKPGIKRQDQDRRDSGAPPPLPARNDQRPATLELGKGRAISIDQGQGRRGPPPLPPRDRAVSMDEKPSCQPLQIRDRKLSEPARGEPHGAPPPLPNRPLRTIPSEPSPASTGSTTCVVNCMTEQSLKSQAIFEEQFIFPPVIQFPAPEAFAKFARV